MKLLTMSKTIKEVFTALAYGSVTAAFLCLMFLITACSSNHPLVTIDTPIYGIYEAFEGTYAVNDSNGEESTSEFTEENTGLLSVNQSGNVVDIMGCLGLMEVVEEGTGKVVCTTYEYTIDPWYGAYSRITEGTVLVDLETKILTMNLMVITTLGDYRMVGEANLSARLSQEFTNMAEGKEEPGS